MTNQARIVYPIGILVMGTELTVLNARATLAKVQGLEPDGPPIHRVGPFAYNVTRFAPDDCLVSFMMVRNSMVRVETIHALGPALIERVILDETRKASNPPQSQRRKPRAPGRRSERS